jgi:hypothetical protein
MRYTYAAITGATSGIGTAFARLLPPETGLLLSGRNAASLAELRSTLASGRRSVETVTADLASADGRAHFIAATRDLPIDLFINNAGLGRLGPIVENPPDAERQMVEVNVVAVAFLTRALLPGMLARAEASGRRAGLIITASTAAFQPLPYLATYAATKAFDLFYTEALASELSSRPIDVLALCPGGTDTQFFARAGMAHSAIGRFATPERVAREGLDALGRKRVHVVGGLNKLSALLAQLAPRRLVTDMAARMMARTIPG